MSSRKKRRINQQKSQSSSNLSTVAKEAVPISVNSEMGTAAMLSLQMSHMTGPIPSPDMLRAYSEVIPGLDKTIVEEWTIEGASRRANEAKELEIRALAVKKHACREQWKVNVVGVFMLGIIALAAYLAYLGQGAHAAAVVATPIAGGAAVKLISKK